MPFGDIACRVVCLFLNIMEQDGICLQAVKKKAIFKKNVLQIVFPEIMIRLLKGNTRKYCEQ